MWHWAMMHEVWHARIIKKNSVFIYDIRHLCDICTKLCDMTSKALCDIKYFMWLQTVSKHQEKWPGRLNMSCLLIESISIPGLGCKLMNCSKFWTGEYYKLHLMDPSWKQSQPGRFWPKMLSTNSLWTNWSFHSLSTFSIFQWTSMNFVK